MPDLTTRLFVSWFCCLFILLGVVVIPYAGVQNDEALFANPLYLLYSKEFSMSVFHHQVVLMVMSYVGTLKTLLYWPILAGLGVSIWSVRLPMLLAGALTIWIFYHLALRSAGRPAALLGVALLATDPSFLLMDTFDWGPVALEHLLLVTGCLFLVRFVQVWLPRDLALGFYCLGLAMWNKAIFGWALAGLVAGGLVVFWPEVRRALRLQNVGLAAVAFLFGASPFVIYNIRHRNATLSAGAHIDATGPRHKWVQLRNTLEGAGLLGFLCAEEWTDRAKTSLSRRGQVALWIRNHLGEHRRNGLFYAFGLGLLAVPLWWRSRAARFSLVFLAVTWLVMTLTRDAGGSAHHVVLLWPFPQLFLAVVFSSLPWRPAIILAGSVLVAMNLLVLNQHILQLDRDGAEGSFTDALFPLMNALQDPPAGSPEQPIYVMDWGMLNTLALFHQGRLPLRVGDEPFTTDTPNESQRKSIEYMLSDLNALFVGHVPSREANPGINARIDRALVASGLGKEVVRSISDSNGHPVFEIFKLRPVSGK